MVMSPLFGPVDADIFTLEWFATVKVFETVFQTRMIAFKKIPRSHKMIRAKLWFRCAAMHDPVTPVIVQPAVVGWDAKKRQVDLTIERAFKGDELVLRMKGWVTVDVKKVIELVQRHGFLKLLDDRDLVVEVETEKDYENLKDDILENFGDQLDLERM